MGEALYQTELWTNDRGTGDAVPRRRRCALDHPALRNRVIAAKQVARAEGFEPPTDPVLETGALAAELRACGRRDRDRTDGLLRFRQALYAT